MAHFAFDIDGTADAAPSQMQSMMSALKAAGHRVSILTGTSNPKATQQDFDEKSNYLNKIGCGQCWDDMTVLPHNGGPLAEDKAKWCVKNGVDALVDNTKENAKAAVAAGVPLVLVPWASRK